MAKSTKPKNDEDNTDVIEEKLDITDPDISGENIDELEEDGDAGSGIELSEIPIEEFMRDPDKLAKITDETDTEESTNWCPQCCDHTIFVDRVCTVCGFTKGGKKNDDKDELEESTDFEILPDEDIIEDLGYGYSDEESFD